MPAKKKSAAAKKSPAAKKKVTGASRTSITPKISTTLLRRTNCETPCTSVIRFLTDHAVPANTGISIPPYTSVDGYRHLNLFVRFTQTAASELPVDLGVIFAFDSSGTMGSRRYVNLEANVAAPQSVNMISVSGSGSWHGSPHNISSYAVRLPVMGPYVEVFVYNRAATQRKVSVWGYLVG